MVGLLTDVMEMLFGTAISDYIGTWMSTLLNAVIGVLEDAGAVTNAMTLFSGIAVSLMTLYFFLELYNNVSREMFTVDRLVVSLIKFFIACAILICLPEFVTGIAKLGKAAYEMISSGGIFNASPNTNPLMQNLQEIATPGSEARAAFEDELIKNNWDGVWGFVSHINLVLSIGGINLLGLAAKIIGCMVCVGNAIMILVYAVMSPIAVANLFEEGSRSAGIRYLKKFAATCFTMALIVLTLQAVSALNSYIVTLALSDIVDANGLPITKLTVDNIGSVLGLTHVGVLLVPQLATITLMSGCTKISAEILGA